jgi:hypothetical protein
MEDCTYCGAEGAEAVCEDCQDVFCKNCIKDGLCPVCGGHNTEHISVESLLADEDVEEVIDKDPE